MIPMNKAFTLIELLVVIAIVAILASITIPSFSGFRREQALRNTTEDLLSLLNQARSDTLGSLNGTNYSVYIQPDKATYFPGSVFSVSNPANTVVVFTSDVTIPAVTGVVLNGGGSTITFDRLTGDTSSYGTITIQLVSDPTRQKVITISKTGLISSN